MEPQPGPVDRGLAVLQRVVNILRPRYYNRLTWLVVGAGLLLAASPWWNDLIPVIAAQFGLQVSTPEAQYGWGYALVATGLVYHALTHFVATFVESQKDEYDRRRRLAHDQEKIGAMDAALPWEALRRYLDGLRREHAYTSPAHDRLRRAIALLSSPANQLLTDALKAKHEHLVSAFVALRSWCEEHFEPNAQDFGLEQTYSLKKQSIQRVGELVDIVNAIESRYQAFRASAKAEIFV